MAEVAPQQEAADAMKVELPEMVDHETEEVALLRKGRKKGRGPSEHKNAGSGGQDGGGEAATAGGSIAPATRMRRLEAAQTRSFTTRWARLR